LQKRAFVGGASQGIGESVARVLAEQGMRVTLFARTEDKLKKLCESLPGQGHDYIAADISQREDWLQVFEDKHKQNPYSVLILNSGGPQGGPISQAEPSEFMQGMENHLVANALMVKVVLDNFKRQNWGRIVTITSTSVRVPIPHLGVSNTVRAAVASWGKTLSLELAPFGITVNNVMPGFTKTPRLENLIRAQADQTQKSFAEVESSWKDKVPMKRFADPMETAHLIGFLCSDKADYITGQSIAVDGGRLGSL
jgi:3-oxoacyl-[acyl-carrier protein] reductase